MKKAILSILISTLFIVMPVFAGPTNFPGGITTGSLGTDIDRGGYYDLNLQNIPDLASKGPGYWFDGADDKVVINDNDNLSFVSGGMSCVVTVNIVDTTLFSMVSKGTTAKHEYLFYTDSSSRLVVEFANSDESAYIGRKYSAAITDYKNKQVTFAFTYDGANLSSGINLYLSGAIVDDTDFQAGSFTGMTNGTADVTIGRIWETPNFSNGTFSNFFLFNLALTADEVKALSSGAPVSQKWLKNATDKPGDTRNSGNFVVGAEYRILTRTDGNFTDAGAADNSVGTEFVATAVAAGVLDGGDTVTRLGCVAQYKQPGIGHNQWLDNSGNELHGTVSGAVAINLPASHEEKYIDLTVTGNGSFTLPMGYKIKSIIVKETAGNALTGGLDVGLTANGVEVVSGMAVAGSATVLCTLVEAGTIGATFTTADDTIYFSDGDDDADWNSAELELRVQMERLTLN